MVGMDCNGSQDEHIKIILVSQSAKENGANDFPIIVSHKAIKISTIGAGHHFLCQIADQGAFLFTFRLCEYGTKKSFYVE